MHLQRAFFVCAASAVIAVALIVASMTDPLTVVSAVVGSRDDRPQTQHSLSPSQHVDEQATTARPQTAESFTAASTRPRATESSAASIGGVDVWPYEQMYPRGLRMCSHSGTDIVPDGSSAYVATPSGVCELERFEVEGLFVHVGPSLEHGLHAFESIRQIRMMNPCMPITWIMSKAAFTTNPHAQAVAHCYSVSVVFTDDFEGDARLIQLRKVFFISGYMGATTSKDFNLFTLSRMFYVRAYMAASVVKRRVFHVENDNMVYEPLDSLDAAYHACGFELAAPIRDIQYTVLGFAYIANAEAVTAMIDSYLDVLSLGKDNVTALLKTIWINDMSLTAYYAKTHPDRVAVLPVRSDTRFGAPNCGFDKTQSLVDGASVAVYHLGDFHTKTPFANTKGWNAYRGSFDPRPYNLQWHTRAFQEYECSQPVLIPKQGNEPTLRMANLHVHHKMLEQTRGACVQTATVSYSHYLAQLPGIARLLSIDFAAQTALTDSLPNAAGEPGVKDRRPSFPLVSGDGFRAACRRWCGAGGCNFKAQDIVRGECIFLDTTNLVNGQTTVEYVRDFMRNILGQIAKPVVVVTHNGDVSMPDGDSHAPYEPRWPTEVFSDLLSHPNVSRWLASNCFWKGYEIGAPRPCNLECIPIGIENRYNRIGSHPESYFAAMENTRVVQQGHTLLVAFGEHRIKPDRARALDALKGKPWVTMREKTDRSQWMKDVQSHRFTLCPLGHGLDTHRTWEVLLLGGIPVVRHSSMDSMYEGLPVVVVKEWSDVTEARLADAWHWVQTTRFHMDRLFWPYWEGRLELARAQAKSWGVRPCINGGDSGGDQTTATPTTLEATALASTATVPCHRWRCTCQGYSDTFGTYSMHWGLAARMSGDVKSWWISNHCDTYPVGATPRLTTPLLTPGIVPTPIVAKPQVIEGCPDELLSAAVTTVYRGKGNIMLLTLPQDNGPEAVRDAPRHRFNEHYARRHGFGWTTCSYNSLMAHVPKMRGLHGRLLKPFCVFAAMMANPTVKWVMLLDSDAVINPLRLKRSLDEALVRKVDEDVHMAVPANRNLDGSAGVAFFNSHHMESVCRWCNEVQGDRYGPWDQTALWSVITELFANKVDSLREFARVVHDAADRHMEKKAPPLDADKEWYKIWAHVQTIPSLLAKGPVRSIPDLATSYGCEGDGAHGEAAGWVWHPAPAKTLCKDDEKALTEALAGIS